MSYTVKQLADLAGVSTRTLHYYDEMGLLPASSYGQNGYRYYNEEALLRLQQILFFRELGFRLTDIKQIIDSPDFNLLHALQTHKRALQERVERLTKLINTVDQTILHVQGKQVTSRPQLFEGFSPEQQQEYFEQARDRWGDTVTESVGRWNNYTQQQQEHILQEAERIYTALVAYVGQDPACAEVQALIESWHNNLRFFYEPTPEVLHGLGQLYVEDPRFAAVYQRLHPELPEFLRQAIMHYCERLPEHSILTLATRQSPGCDAAADYEERKQC